MSKTLLTLVKVSQKKLDDQTKVITDLQQKKQAFIDEKERLKVSIDDAINSAVDDSFIFNMAHNYAAKAKAGILYLDDQMVKIEELIAQEREVMKGLFLEKKRHEILLEEYNRKRKAEYNKKVQAQMDDFNSIAFINKAK
jgi:phosphosulfolactate phosphohydrolase-like enzyme